jgi:hypothetical protein
MSGRELRRKSLLRKSDSSPDLIGRFLQWHAMHGSGIFSPIQEVSDEI